MRRLRYGILHLVGNCSLCRDLVGLLVALSLALMERTWQQVMATVTLWSVSYTHLPPDVAQRPRGHRDHARRGHVAGRHRRPAGDAVGLRRVGRAERRRQARAAGRLFEEHAPVDRHRQSGERQRRGTPATLSLIHI